MLSESASRRDNAVSVFDVDGWVRVLNCTTGDSITVLNDIEQQLADNDRTRIGLDAAVHAAIERCLAPRFRLKAGGAPVAILVMRHVSEQDATLVLSRAELISAIESLSASHKMSLELHPNRTDLGARRGGGRMAECDDAKGSRIRGLERSRRSLSG